ncbi:MAG: hypothetical protein O2779_03470 [Nanoarchaeota archaeon]|nr:hypothetical protein [Nanoarchaeota archaeon]
MGTELEPEGITPTRVVLRYFYQEDNVPLPTVRQTHNAICSLVNDDQGAVLTYTIDRAREQQRW